MLAVQVLVEQKEQACRRASCVRECASYSYSVLPCSPLRFVDNLGTQLDFLVLSKEQSLLTDHCGR